MLENPVLKFTTGGRNDEVDAANGESVEYPQVLSRFGALIALTTVGAVAGWTALFEYIGGAGLLLFFGGLFALALIAVAGVFAFRSGRVGPGISLASTYALGQGAYLGYVSRVVDSADGSGVVVQAALGTALTVLSVVVYSATPLGKRTGGAAKGFILLACAYLVFSVISLALGAYTGLGGGWGVFGLGWAGVITCFVGVALAAWAVNIDVVTINTMVRNPSPQRPGTTWALAFGLIVSVLWLYVEILRLVTVGTMRGISRGAVFA